MVAAARQSPVESDFLIFAGNNWAFCDDRAQGAAHQRTNRALPGDAYTAAPKLLNFAAALLRPFRIV